MNSLDYLLKEDFIFITKLNKAYVWKENNYYVFGFILIC